MHAFQVLLRNGARLRIRPAEPRDESSLAVLLGPRPRSSRGPVERNRPSAVTSLRFAGLGDVAWVAVAITEPGQPIVGAARYVRDPAAGTSAGASVAVASRLRGQGLGRLLLETLMLVALESGVVRLVARVQEENAAGVRLLRGLGAKVTQRGSGFLEYELPVGWGERTLASSSGFRAPRPEQLRAGREP